MNKENHMVWSSTACHKGRKMGRMKTGSPEQQTGHHYVLRKQSVLSIPPGSNSGPLHFFKGEATTVLAVTSIISATKLNRD